MEESGEIMPGSEYQDKDETTGVEMLEYHVDTSNKLIERVTTHLGGNLSIYFPIEQKPLIVFGHDECIYKQFLMSAKMGWTKGRNVCCSKR